jgi:hypothetical protein
MEVRCSQVLDVMSVFQDRGTKAVNLCSRSCAYVRCHKPDYNAPSIPLTEYVHDARCCYQCWERGGGFTAN